MSDGKAGSDRCHVRKMDLTDVMLLRWIYNRCHVGKMDLTDVM